MLAGIIETVVNTQQILGHVRDSTKGMLIVNNTMLQSCLSIYDVLYHHLKWRYPLTFSHFCNNIHFCVNKDLRVLDVLFIFISSFYSHLR